MVLDFHKHRIYYDSVTSTNDVLYNMACEGADNGTVLIADRQTKGKGSYGRTWFSEKGDNIYCSLLLKTQLSEREASIFSIATAIGIQYVLDRTMRNKVWIKWPNDIISNKRKICGILSEVHKSSLYGFLIIGFGINVNQIDFPDEIRDKASSLQLLEHHKFDKEQLLEQILTELEHIYEVCLREKDLGKYVEEINSCLIRKDEEVFLLKGSRQEKVWLNAVNKDGSLSVTDQEGEIRTVYSGEVSIRGSRRYV